MHNHQFLISAGGTGAKVVEALIHLCGAGLGPEKLDILLLDVDESNGNVSRTRDTWELYRKLAVFDWATADRKFFHTEITMHCCIGKIGCVSEGGLRRHFGGDSGSVSVLDLLYDESEQNETCRQGFLAKPNLGSLVLGEHVRECFETMPGARAFIDRIGEVCDGAPQQKVPLMVVGSIFGGTGASLFPVVCHQVKEALGSKGATDDHKEKIAANRWEKIHPGALLMLPYFQPDDFKVGSVDPSRFFLDTRNSLRHYDSSGGLKAFSSVYFVGSNQPGRNPLQYEEGSKDQANPPFLEEVVAACGIIDLGTAGRTGNHVFQPNCPRFGWGEFPCDPSLPAQQALASFLQLAAFVIRPMVSDAAPLSGGLVAALRDWTDKAELEQFPFFDALLAQWALKNCPKANVAKTRPGDRMRLVLDSGQLEGDRLAVNDLLEEFESYSFRLLVWAETSLPSLAEEDNLLSSVAGGDALPIWEAMSATEVEKVETQGRDNALVRLARMATAAIVNIGSNQITNDGSFAYFSEEGVSELFRGYPGRSDSREGVGPLQLITSARELENIGKRSPYIGNEIYRHYRGTDKS
jgi:hypothetical protein